MKENSDKALRDHLLYVLGGGGAHATFEDAIKDLPEGARGKKAGGLPHTAWMLLEHLRIGQEDILDFSRNPKYQSLPWPEGYWPKTEAPPSAKAWDESVARFRKDLKEMESLVRDAKTVLFTKLPWGDGQTVLREALLVADHNAYHIAQLVDVRRALGAWKE